MYEELREEAKQKVDAKIGFYVCAMTFSLAAVVLLMLSFYLPGATPWLLFPIPILVMVLGIVYVSAFGLPISGALSKDWKEEEIEREMRKLYRQKGTLPPPKVEELSEEDQLELKELHRLKQKWEWGDEFV